MLNNALSVDITALNRHSISNRALTICVFAGLFYCYEYYLRVAPSVISFELMQTFNISNTGLGLLSAIFYYTYLVGQIPVGLIIDRFGPRIVLTMACTICCFGTYIFTYNNSILSAQIGRLIVGLGSAFAFIGSLKIISNWLPRQHYALMVGLCSSLGMLGGIGGEMLLAKQIQLQPWQTALNLSALVGLGLSILMWVIIRDTPTEHRLQTESPSRTQLLSNLLKILRNKEIWLAGLIGALTFLPISSFAEMWAVPYLEVIGYSKTQAAFASSMIFLGFGIGAPIWGIISNKFASRRLPLILGSIVSGFSAACVILMPYLPSFYIFSALFCLGFFASAEILVFALGNDIATKETNATTVAVINMIIILGAIIMQPVVGMILDIISTTSVSQYQTALLVMPLCLIVAAVLSFILSETYHKP